MSLKIGLHLFSDLTILIPFEKLIPMMIFLYLLASLELIAEEIEDPFGLDANDLPTEKIASNIKKHVEEIL